MVDVVAIITTTITTICIITSAQLVQIPVVLETIVVKVTVWLWRWLMIIIHQLIHSNHVVSAIIATIIIAVVNSRLLNDND